LARLARHAGPEAVALVTSQPPCEPHSAQWLAAHRAAWAVDSSLRQRLDVSHREDVCRLRRAKALRRMGMFQRFSDSRLEWRRRQKQPHPQTTTGFFGAVNADRHRCALRCFLPHQPSLQTAS